MNIWLAKKVLGGITTKIMKVRELKLLRKGNKKRDGHEIQINQLQKTNGKHGKCIEELEKDNAIMKRKIAILEKDSHPSQEYICCRKCGCKITKVKNK